MRNSFINNFQMGPTIAEAAAAATPDDNTSSWVDDTVAVGGVLASIIKAVNPSQPVVYTNSNGTAYMPSSSSTTSNSIVVYILIAVAIIVALYFFLKK